MMNKGLPSILPAIATITTIAPHTMADTLPLKIAKRRIALVWLFGAGGPFALLATIAIQTGDKAEARKNLRHLLDYNHDNIAAARTLATLALEANAGDEIDFALEILVVVVGEVVAVLRQRIEPVGFSEHRSWIIFGDGIAETFRPQECRE